MSRDYTENRMNEKTYIDMFSFNVFLVHTFSFLLTNMPLKEGKNICKIKWERMALDAGTFKQIYVLAAILFFGKR